MVLVSLSTCVLQISLGTCPGLYSSDELTAISNQLLPGGQMGVRRTENKEVAQERFLRRIRTNLHVAVCVWHGDLQRITQRYPTILTRSACVDVFREWKSDVLTTVAKSWLLEKGTNQFLVKVPWDIPQRDVQLKAIYEVMSQIHQSVRRESEKDFSGQGLEVFSPLKFTEFIDLFRTLCNWICEVKEVGTVDFVCFSGISRN